MGPDEYRARMVRDILYSEHIHAVLVNKKDSSYGWGYYEVHVMESERIKAQQVVQEKIDFV